MQISLDNGHHRRRPPLRFALIVVAAVQLVTAASAHGEDTAARAEELFAKENLVAWCIVPFDGKHRSPAERAEMLNRLGLTKVAYDWRAEHVPTFEAEILEYQEHGIEYFAFWSTHDEAFRLFEKYGLQPQIWQTLHAPVGETQGERIAAAAEQLRPLVERTRQMGCKLGLYNHGAWGGEPENLVAMCEHLRETQGGEHVGIVYNLHHGHAHIDTFAEHLELMRPYLLCLNLNGMDTAGDQHGRKILPLGAGEHDVLLLRTIADSGYRGPIGIIGHTMDDVELRLRDNLAGLEWIVRRLNGRGVPRPEFLTWP